MKSKPVPGKILEEADVRVKNSEEVELRPRIAIENFVLHFICVVLKYH